MIYIYSGERLLFTLQDLSFNRLSHAHYVGGARTSFVKTWWTWPSDIARLAHNEKGEIVGIGCFKKAYVGYKIMPLFAETSQIADLILKSLVDACPIGEEITYRCVARMLKRWSGRRNGVRRTLVIG